jgi:hypothetical protein
LRVEGLACTLNIKHQTPNNQHQTTPNTKIPNAETFSISVVKEDGALKLSVANAGSVKPYTPNPKPPNRGDPALGFRVWGLG